MKTFKQLFRTSYISHINYVKAFVDSEKAREEFFLGVNTVNYLYGMSIDLADLEKQIQETIDKRIESATKPWYKTSYPHDNQIDALQLALDVIKSITTRFITGFSMMEDNAKNEDKARWF